MSTTLILGSVRVTSAGAIVVDTNTGAVLSILHNGDGDDTVTLDPLFQIGANDTVDAQTEGATPGSIAVERLTTSTFRVRTLDTGGAALVAGYALRILHTLVG